MHSHLLVIGLSSHAVAPTAWEHHARLRPSADEVSAHLVALPGAVAVLTCSRSELWISGTTIDEGLARWTAAFGPDTNDVMLLEGVEAAVHVLRLASGLESPILGEREILGQLRQAVAAAEAAGRLDSLLRDLARVAFTTARRVRRETQLSCAQAGIGASVADVVVERWAPSPRDRVAVLGTGAAARAAARALVRRQPGTVVVVGRNGSKAADLAREVGATWSAWTDLDRVLVAALVVVAATSAPTPVLEAERLLQAAHDRRGRLGVVDIGMPANAVPVPAVDLVSLADVHATRDAAAARRVASIPRAAAIIEGALSDWGRPRRTPSAPRCVA